MLKKKVGGAARVSLSNPSLFHLFSNEKIRNSEDILTFCHFIPFLLVLQYYLYQSVCSVAINNDSGEVNPSVVNGRTGLLQRSTMTDKRSSPLQIMESSTTAVTVRTQSRGMMVCGIPIPIVIGSVLGGVVLYCVLCSWLLLDIVPSYEMSRTVSITIEEFGLVTSSSSPVLTYNLSVMMGIYNPSLYVPTVTKPFEAAFFFGGQRLHVVRFGDNGQHLATTLVSLGPLRKRDARHRRCRRVQERGLYGYGVVVRGGDGGGGPGDVLGCLHHMQCAGDVPVQAAARGTGRRDN